MNKDIELSTINTLSNTNSIKKSDRELLDDMMLPNWEICISFGKSTSPNYRKVVSLAKRTSQKYIETFDEDCRIIHQANFDLEHFRKFDMLYTRICTWKSTYVFVGSQILTHGTISHMNWHYWEIEQKILDSKIPRWSDL